MILSEGGFINSNATRVLTSIIVCIFMIPIAFFNRSLAFDILTRFDSIYCIFNVLVYHSLYAFVQIRFLEYSIIGVLFKAITAAIVIISWLLYDSLPDEIFTLQFRKILFGVFSIYCCYTSLTYMNVFENTPTYIISIFDIYEFDLGKSMYSSWFGITAFCCKMFIFAFIAPENHVQHSIALKKMAY